MTATPTPVYDGECLLRREYGTSDISSRTRVTRADPFVQVAEEVIAHLEEIGGELVRETVHGVTTQTLHLPGGVAYRLHSYDADLLTYKADRIDA